MGICETAAQAATGLRTGAGANLFNALNLIAAADVAIRVGSGGQAGATDLPRLVTDERGIECYSPELGQSIWVTPFQWYANNMSCSGLRDPDREALEKRIKELEDRARRRNEIRSRGYEIDPRSQVSPEMQDFINRRPPANEQFGPTGMRDLEFTKEGVLTFDFIISNWNTGLTFTKSQITLQKSINTNNSFQPGGTGKKTFPISPGDRLSTESRNYQNVNTSSGISNGYVGSNRTLYLNKASGLKIPISSWYTQSSFNTSPPAAYENHTYHFISGFAAGGSQGSLNFEPEGSPPGMGGGSTPPGTPINPSEPPEPPEENNCMGGCRCGDIAQATRQNTQAMERLIKEIHNAVNAGAFASGNFMFAPEGMIENQGRTIYSQNPGRGGTIRSKNLFEAVSALIASHYHRMGLHRFPAKVPDNLIPKTGLGGVIDAVDGDTKDLQDFAAFQKWQFDQWDAATGHYPIKFKITDDGGKAKDVFLWNQSEALAEIFGMLTKVVEDADIGVQWGVRASTEAVGAKAAALKALFAIEQLIEFSGGLSEKKYQEMKLSFTPDPFGDVSKVEEMLKPSTQKIEVIDIVDGRSLLGLLLHISYYSQLGGLAVLGDTKPNPSTGQSTTIPGDGIREQKKKDKQQQSKFEKDWDKWKTKTKGGFVPNSTQQQSRGGLPKPNLEDITTQNRQP